MATISAKSQQIAKNFVNALREKLDVKKAILFGSSASGRAGKDSDIDLLIISDEFKKMPLIERLVFLSRSRGQKFSNWPMDILGYTQDEFDKLSGASSMFAEVKKNGIELK